jgi:2-polyprenyl-3-methyl-5-hydroxy-6-metoxy-1,4-benzoquinol methylase
MKNLFSGMVRCIFTSSSRYAYNRRIGGMVSSLLPDSGGEVLDLGCGDGRYAKLFDGRDYTGLDIGDYDYSAVAAPNRTFRKGSAEAIPFDRESFDLVFSSFMIEHVKDIRSSLGRIGELIRPGGAVFVSTGTRCAALTGEMHRIFWPGDGEEVGQAHHYFRPDELKEMFRAAGFTSISVRRVGGPSALLTEMIITFFRLLAMKLRGERYGHSRESDEAAKDRIRPRKRSSLIWKLAVPLLFLVRIILHELTYWLDLLLMPLRCAKFVVITARNPAAGRTGNEEG